MAAKIYNVYLVETPDVSVMVYEKKMKHIIMRVSHRDPSTLHLSVPAGMRVSDVHEFIEVHKPQMLKMLKKANNVHLQSLHIPEQSEINRLRGYLADLVPELEHAMGVSANRYSIRYMTSRWGSCSPVKRSISINSALSLLPKEFTEYVLVHELAHITEPNHSPSFWRIVAEFCPDWRIIRAKLKRYSL